MNLRAEITVDELLKAMKLCACVPECSWCAYYDPKKLHKDKCYERRNRDFEYYISNLQDTNEALINGQETLQRYIKVIESGCVSVERYNAIVEALTKESQERRKDTIACLEKSNDELRSALKKKDDELKAARHYYNECLKDLKKAHAEINELTEKLECLLCHATGSKLSKSTYSLRTMESAVNDEVQECCEEARAEAIKEFAERLKEIYATHDGLWITIDNLVKEMVGDANIATTTETEGDTE